MSEKMTTSEPTTENIAKALRVCYVKSMACSECPLEPEDCGHIDEVAADRLESQENELSEITGELERFRAFHERYAEQTSKKYVNDICALTARAEQAERERDAADNGSYDLYKRFESISDEVRKESPSCKLCGNFPERCAFCLKYNAFELRGLRGQPQEGEKE